MKLFITGGAGFIGSNFILYWLKHHPNDHVVNFDALTYAGNLENLVSVEKNPNYTFIKGDICDSGAVQKAMDKCDTVVHFAAESHVDRSILEPAAFVKTNVLGTQVLLNAVLKVGIKRFHHISTDEVFGSLDLDENKKFDENAPYNPHSPYAASKASADMLVRAYGHTFGLPFTISNCSNNYGPYQFPEKLVPLMILNAIQNKPLPVYGDGLNVRDWIHVEDHSRAIELILIDGQIGQTYCVGGEAEMNNVDVVKMVLDILHKTHNLIKYVKDRPGHDRRYAIDNSKIKKELGFTPSLDFDTGLRQTVEWYQQNPSWCDHVINHQYEKYYAKQYG